MAAKEVKLPEEPTNETLAVKALKLGYPAKLANKKNRKDNLKAMIAAGKYPNEQFPEPTEKADEAPNVGEPAAETTTEEETTEENKADNEVTDPETPTEEKADEDGGEASTPEEDVTTTPIAGDPKGLYDGLDVLMPANARVVFGGPVIKKVPHPQGFTVGEQLTEKELKKYGVGKGVVYHSVKEDRNGFHYTYRIVYPTTN